MFRVILYCIDIIYSKSYLKLMIVIKNYDNYIIIILLHYYIITLLHYYY